MPLIPLQTSSHLGAPSPSFLVFLPLPKVPDSTGFSSYSTCLSDHRTMHSPWLQVKPSWHQPGSTPREAHPSHSDSTTVKHLLTRPPVQTTWPPPVPTMPLFSQFLQHRPLSPLSPHPHLLSPVPPAHWSHSLLPISPATPLPQNSVTCPSGSVLTCPLFYSPIHPAPTCQTKFPEGPPQSVTALARQRSVAPVSSWIMCQAPQPGPPGLSAHTP